MCREDGLAEHFPIWTRSRTGSSRRCNSTARTAIVDEMPPGWGQSSDVDIFATFESGTCTAPDTNGSFGSAHFRSARASLRWNRRHSLRYGIEWGKRAEAVCR